MSRSTDRIVAGVAGFVLLALGVTGLLAGWGTVELDGPAELLDSARDSTTGSRALWLGVVVSIALLAFAAGAALLRRGVLRPPRPGPVELAQGPRGATRLEPAAVERALRADLRRQPGVYAGRVLLRTAGPRPRLRVRLDIDPDTTDVDAARAAAEEAYGRLVSCLALEGVSTDLVIRVGRPSSSRAPSPPRVQ